MDAHVRLGGAGMRARMPLERRLALQEGMLATWSRALLHDGRVRGFQLTAMAACANLRWEGGVGKEGIRRAIGYWTGAIEKRK